jgi:septum formation topological specificity factor MinE
MFFYTKCPDLRKRSIIIICRYLPIGATKIKIRLNLKVAKRLLKNNLKKKRKIKPLFYIAFTQA